MEFSHGHIIALGNRFCCASPIFIASALDSLGRPLGRSATGTTCTRVSDAFESFQSKRRFGQYGRHSRNGFHTDDLFGCRNWNEPKNYMLWTLNLGRIVNMYVFRCQNDKMYIPATHLHWSDVCIHGSVRIPHNPSNVFRPLRIPAEAYCRHCAQKRKPRQHTNPSYRYLHWDEMTTN